MSQAERISKLEEKTHKLEEEVDSLREFKHATNGTLQQHEGVLMLIKNTFERAEKNFNEKMDRVEKIVAERGAELVKLNNLKFIIIGGCAFLSVAISTLAFAIKFYFDYMGTN